MPLIQAFGKVNIKNYPRNNKRIESLIRKGIVLYAEAHICFN